jgi:hypothetical protein
MDARELAFLPLAALADRLRRRELSPVEITRVYLDRIATLDPTLRAFITVTAEQALAEATAAEREIAAGQYRSPLHGVPLALKDLFYTAGVRTTAGSRILADFVPAEDATVVARRRAAGSAWARPTSRSSPTARPPSIPITAPVATRGIRRGSPAGPAAARPRRWWPASVRRASAPIAADRSASRRRCAASWA